MSRNRDENGDGKIDADEVKWYLATVDQYKGLWIGEEQLPTGAKLFLPTDDNWKALNTAYSTYTGKSKDASLAPWHYFTASEQAVFWPEEGASTSDYNAISTYGKASLARCVRTLQSNDNGLSDPDVYYEQPVKNSDNTWDIKLRINSQRGLQTTPMQPSLERGEKSNNDIYNKIRVDATNLGTSYTRSQIISSVSDPDTFIGAYSDVCWTGKNGSESSPWRVPNEKELLIMSVVKADNGNQFDLSITNFLWSNTYFTGLVKDPKKFNANTTITDSYYKSGSVENSNGLGLVMFSNGRFSISPGASNGTVRCVMDVKE